MKGRELSADAYDELQARLEHNYSNATLAFIWHRFKWIEIARYFKKIDGS